MTAYHSKYYAHELTKQSSSNSIAKLGASLFNATVDLNPHQLDAALFAFRSPLSRGSILADEVGLGKTIEAGIVISQLWAERKRRILVICPTILRKQWAQELADKFYTPSWVIDAREYNQHKRQGASNPLVKENSVTICSYHFAFAKEAEFAATRWDLVVIDEAHRLRNVYKTSNKIAAGIKRAVRGRPTLLLTATPLQNSLLELYGLVSFLDEHLFGDINAFRARYMRGAVEERELKELRQRLKPICQRTLRRQVTEYVRFTNRIPITQDFTPTPEEQKLYEQVSDYLQREKLNALPNSQRKLMTLVLRKLLASSTFAISGTLASLATRLQHLQQETAGEKPLTDELDEDFETFEEVAEEWSDSEADNQQATVSETWKKEEIADIQAELNEIVEYGKLAASITTNAKGDALLQALNLGFQKLEELGAARKAVIFTESRRTQAYLFELLSNNGHAGRVLTINGTNTDDRAGNIYREWVMRHAGESVATGNKTVDLRAALVEHFRETADILIATEAAAEGVNLQFCSFVVNYDLPWNPQRIEQRIGRCHRYGQKHDVVVVNFLNRSNAADQRVFELLSEKFRLFDGVFGSSDEVLGALESGVDFERRIAEIYQNCRTSTEIDAAFAELQAELETQITERMTDTRRALLENFDEEVHQRLRTSYEDSKSYLSNLERSLWELTKFELTVNGNDNANFDEELCEFDLLQTPTGLKEAPIGLYRFVTRKQETDGAHPYRLGDQLAEQLIAKAKERTLSSAEIVFDYTNHQGKIGLLDSLIGQSGWMSVTRMQITSLEEEDHLLYAVITDDGKTLHPETGEKIFRIRGSVRQNLEPNDEISTALENQQKVLREKTITEINNRNTQFFDEEIDKLERWADDLKYGLEMELKDLDAQIRALKKDSKLAIDLQSKLEMHRLLKDAEGERSRKRRQLYEAQDQIDEQKEDLISSVEARLQQKIETEDIFTIRWRLI
jgi:superfamily II DNA or RNA helicase